MAIDVDIKPISSLTNENSAIQILNNNFAALVAALQQVLSTTEYGENTMNVPLDMNSQAIINTANPTSGTSAANKNYVDEMVSGLAAETIFLFVEKEDVGTKIYVHQQTVAATEWIISHNLKTNPTVTVFDATGGFMLAEYYYVDINTVRVVFDVPTSGVAYLK